MRYKILLLSLLFGLGGMQLHATHNRAGEIRVEQIDDCTSLTIRATITTYTDIRSVNADRDTLELCWGDGTCTRIRRSNGALGNGEPIGNFIKKNLYIAEHTYPGRATYNLTMTDPNRVSDILNVNFPNSVNVPFHVATTYTFLNPQFQGCNSTPILLQPPIDIGCVGQPFQHNPNAFDPDGDSLSYAFVTPLQDVRTPVPRYLFPNQIIPGAENLLTINERTGDVLWDAPQREGEYNLALIIVEWRNGVPIDTTIRDMQISVEDCQNLPPEVEVPFEEICVIAGEVIEFDVVATAPLEESEQQIQLQAFGGPLILDVSPATFEDNTNEFRNQPSTKRFRWETTCEHISDQPYSVIFRGVDDFLSDETGLATLKTVRIKVVGPPPEDVQAISTAGKVSVTWEKPYACEVTENEYFRGFSIWRRQGSNPFELDTCENGLDGKGYTRLAFDQLTMNAAGDRYEFIDEEVERGRTYCYRILAEFAKLSPSGNFPYNRVASLPSKEVCVQLSRDVPLITNVSVLSTANGQMEVRWSKPNATDLDTIQNPPPYRYEVLRATGIGGTDFQPVETFQAASFVAANDTIFIDENLNLTQVAYTYKVAFYVNNESIPLGETQTASSVFLTVSPTDKTNVLTWEEAVPWINTRYVVYEIINGSRAVLDTTSTPLYRHTGLENGTEYCYQIESIGSYGIDQIIDPIINFSQETCGVPVDNVSPCAPVLEVLNICEATSAPIPLTETENFLVWTNPNTICEDTDDVTSYNIYYAPMKDQPLQRIGFTSSALDTFFVDTPGESIAGCYAVTAIDGSGNESVISDTTCVDNCPIYNLPNTFTPNGDGANDLFIPYPYRFIDQIDLKIVNRWGQIVFETNNPEINWDGNNLSNEALAEGVYFYTCQVFEKRVIGVVPQAEPLTGVIHLIRGNN